MPAPSSPAGRPRSMEVSSGRRGTRGSRAGGGAGPARPGAGYQRQPDLELLEQLLLLTSSSQWPGPDTPLL